MGNLEVKIPIIKNGKDICRLIFIQFENGVFDVKIDSLGKSFSVQTYREIGVRPHKMEPYLWKAEGELMRRNARARQD